MDWRAWARAANPLRRSETEAEAVRAARLGAVAIVAMAVHGLATLPQIGATLERGEQAIRASVPPTGDPAGAAYVEQVIAVLPTLIAGATLVMSVVFLVLAWVQWRKPNPIIPAIILGITLYGLVVMATGPWTNPMWDELAPPLHVAILGTVLSLLETVLLAAALRGALRLSQLRGPQRPPHRDGTRVN